jgi:hypothetical protein
MKTSNRITFLLFLSLILSHQAIHAKSGFFLPDSISEFTLKYRTEDNLIILPVVVNDSILVNLILDTGCRNIILFGKRFASMFSYQNGRTVQFSGMGSGKAVQGMLSLNNTISIGSVLGQMLPVIVVPDKNVMRNYSQVHGIIGYDIFSRFEIQLEPLKQLITFRSALCNYVPDGYTKIPLTISDSKPMVRSSITLEKTEFPHDLLIDTGSILGLLIKSTELKKFKGHDREYPIGVGLNGYVSGFVTTANNLVMGDLEIRDLSAGIIHSPWYNYASIGMGILKDYSIIINYPQSYACLKKNA